MMNHKVSEAGRNRGGLLTAAYKPGVSNGDGVIDDGAAVEIGRWQLISRDTCNHEQIRPSHKYARSPKQIHHQNTQEDIR